MVVINHVFDIISTGQLLSMPEFWDVVPIGLQDMKEEADAAVRNMVDLATGSACLGCTSIRSVLLPLHNRLWSHIASLQMLAPKAIVPLCDLIAKKRDYRNSHLVVYYQDAGKAAVVTLPLRRDVNA